MLKKVYLFCYLILVILFSNFAFGMEVETKHLQVNLKDPNYIKIKQQLMTFVQANNLYKAQQTLKQLNEYVYKKFEAISFEERMKTGPALSEYEKDML